MHARAKALVPLLLAAFAAAAGAPRDGVPDPNFGTGGVATFATLGTTGISIAAPRDVVEQRDGRLLVVGHGRRTGGTRSHPMVMRLLPDGQRDDSFGDQGIFLAPEDGFSAPNGGHASAAEVLDDGRIVVVGSLRDSSDFSNRGCTLVFSLNSSGALDDSWGPAPGPACLDFGRPFGGTPIPIGNIARGPGASVYVSGLLGNGIGGTAVLARLDAQGRFDVAYDADGMVYFGSDFYAGIATHGLRSAGDGTVWVLGGRDNGPTVARLDGSGQLVASFGSSGFATFRAFPTLAENAIDFDVDADGRVAFMSYTFEASATIANAVIRFDTNGQLDGSFNPSGQQAGSPGVAYLSELANQISNGVRWRDEDLVAVGAPGFTILALQPDAAPDAAFGDPSTPGRITVSLGNAWSTRVLRGGAIVVAGWSPSPVTLLKLTSDRLFADDFE